MDMSTDVAISFVSAAGFGFAIAWVALVITVIIILSVKSYFDPILVSDVWTCIIVFVSVGFGLTFLAWPGILYAKESRKDWAKRMVGGGGGM